VQSRKFCHIYKSLPIDVGGGFHLLPLFRPRVKKTSSQDGMLSPLYSKKGLMMQSPSTRLQERSGQWTISSTPQRPRASRVKLVADAPFGTNPGYHVSE